MNDSNGSNDPSSHAATSDMETDYVVGQDNIEGQLGPFGFDVHNRVFVVSALASAVFIVLTLLFPQRAGAIFQSIVAFSTGTLDGYFMIVVNIFVLFSLAMIVLPYGK
ncbi:MAG: BCCT family transporter, partial [Halomonas sp.]|nr:BCCT family transporter [Halomonas sp.]